MSQAAGRPALVLERRALARPAGYPATIAMATLACALGPAYVVRWRVGPLPTTLLEAVILATVAVFLLETLRAGARLSLRSSLTIPTAAFLVAGALSVLASPGRTAAVGLYRAYFVEPVLFGLVLVHVVRSWRAALIVVGGLWAGAAALALANLGVEIQLARHHALNATWMPPVAIYTSQNQVSLYLDPLVAVAAAVAVHQRDRLARAAAVAFLLVALPAEVLGLSRAGWIAVLAVAAGLALTVRARWVLVGAGAAAALALVVSGRVVQLFDSVKGNTIAGRVEMWQAALQLLRRRPVFGAGLTGYPDLIRPFWRHYDPLWALHPHDIVLNFWAETGILGLLAFAAIMAVAASLAWRGWRYADAGWRPLHLGVLLALLAIVVHGLVDVPYFKNDLSLEFWTLLALVVAGAPAARGLAFSAGGRARKAARDRAGGRT